MLVGNAGSGKSTLAARFPSPCFLSLDKNLRGPAAVMLSEGKTDISYEDAFDVDDQGKPVPEAMRYQRFCSILTKVLADPSVKTVVIDNTTILSDYIIAEVLRQNGRKAMEMRDWGAYLGAWKFIVAQLRQCGKNVIIITHERVEKDDMDGQLKYFLAIPGQSADILPTLVTDVWRCEVEEKLVGTTRKHIRNVRVVQSARHAHLKSSTPSLPAVFEATTPQITAIMNQLTTPR